MDDAKSEHIARRKRIGDLPQSCRSYKDNVLYSKTDQLKCLIVDATSDDFKAGPCGSARNCMCCEMWATKPRIIRAPYNGKQVQCQITREANCRTKNVVYALTCPDCDICYVGETKQTLSQRMSKHRTNIRGRLERTHLVEHFHSAHGRIVIPQVRILQTLANESSKTELQDAEAMWIYALNAAFPWGLNTNVKGCGAITCDTDPAERRTCAWFRCRYQRPLQRGYKQRKHRKTAEIRVNSDDTSERALQHFVTFGFDLKSKYRWLACLKTGELSRIVELALSNCHEIGFSTYQQLASYQLAHHSKEKPLIDKPVYIPFEYVNRHSNVLNPERVLRTRGLYPDDAPKASLPRVIFTKSFGPTLGSKALNYNRILRRLNHEQMIKLETDACRCNSERLRRFVNAHWGHVCTGDLEVIEDETLRELMGKGSTFRQTTDDDVDLARESCIQALMLYLHKIVKKQNAEAAKTMYEQMRATVYDLAKKCSIYAKSQELKPIQNYVRTKKSLRKLAEQFVIAPVDKAQNNFAFICPKLYIAVLNKELGVQVNTTGIQITGNTVYELVDEAEEHIVSRHTNETLSLIGETLKQENRVMPKLWASPKFHKNPIKFRFIAGAKRASTKQMSVTLAKILFHMKEHWKRYTTTVSERKGHSCYWSIEHSGQVIQMLRRHKLPDNCKLAIADFSTLYTSFDHAVIKTNAKEMIEMLFQHSKAKYISIGLKAYYHSSETRNCKKYTCADVISLLDFLIDNSYVSYAGSIFHQVSGIPMGANFSPVLADLCLSYMEFKYLKNNPRSGLRLNFTTRYIDDLLSVGSEALLEVAKDIYPASLPLSFDDTANGKGHYLDLAIDRNDKSIGLFDKRKDFSFDVIRFTDAQSNVPRCSGLNTLYSQAIRLARICSRSEELQSGLKDLVHIMREKGFADVELQRTMNNIRTKYPALFARHKLRAKTDIKKLIASCDQRRFD